jgi:hypothetical protein
MWEPEVMANYLSIDFSSASAATMAEKGVSTGLEIYAVR